MGSAQLLDDDRDAPPGDPSWVVAAYQQYCSYVWALLGRLGVPYHSIEDVVQEVFLVLHRRRGEFRNDGDVRRWLHGITLFAARRHREQRIRNDRPERELLAPSPSHTPETEVAGRRALERLDRILAALSDEQREVFVLARVAGLSATEIAELLGISVNTVYSRLRLARGHLELALAALAKDLGVE